MNRAESQERRPFNLVLEGPSYDILRRQAAEISTICLRASLAASFESQACDRPLARKATRGIGGEHDRVLDGWHQSRLTGQEEQDHTGPTSERHGKL